MTAVSPAEAGTVMVVDDDPDIRESMTLVLSMQRLPRSYCRERGRGAQATGCVPAPALRHPAGPHDARHGRAAVPGCPASRSGARGCARNRVLRGPQCRQESGGARRRFLFHEAARSRSAAHRDRPVLPAGAHDLNPRSGLAAALRRRQGGPAQGGADLGAALGNPPCRARAHLEDPGAAVPSHRMERGKRGGGGVPPRTWGPALRRRCVRSRGRAWPLTAAFQLAQGSSGAFGPPAELAKAEPLLLPRKPACRSSACTAYGA